MYIRPKTHKQTQSNGLLSSNKEIEEYTIIFWNKETQS